VPASESIVCPLNNLERHIVSDRVGLLGMSGPLLAQTRDRARDSCPATSLQLARQLDV
jgi:hypothetical protein